MVFVVGRINLHIHVLKTLLLKQDAVLLGHGEGKRIADFVIVAYKLKAK